MKLNSITIDAAGNIGLQFIKSSGEFHRTMVSCDEDVDAQIAVVNAHAEKMGVAPCDTSVNERVKKLAQVAWTPEMIAAAKERKAEEARKAEEERKRRDVEAAEAEKREAEKKAQQEAAFSAAVASAVKTHLDALGR